jgi:hypothetical protein
LQAWTNVLLEHTSTNHNWEWHWLFVIVKRTWRVLFSFNLKGAQFGYETVIDSNFSKTSYIVIFPKYCLVMNTWNIEIIGYEVGVGVNF